MGITLGATHDTGGTVFVYREPIERVSHWREEEMARVLAYTIAHEVGHVLLPYPGHTSSGLMREVWARDDLFQISRGSMRFTPAQASAMRAKVSQCFLANASRSLPPARDDALPVP